MHVKQPRNINPEDLGTRGPEFARPVTEPTLMYYYLRSVRLATTCRDIADSLWAKLQTADPSEIEPQTVTALDMKFENQARELPLFMRIDTSLAQLTQLYGKDAAEAMDAQRLLINLILNTRRCKLHMPFLVRAKTHPCFASSRIVGLQAARNVFEARRQPIQNEQSLVAYQLRLGGLLQHLFLATIVLVMDLCINKDETTYTNFQISWIGSFANFILFACAVPAGTLADRSGPTMPILLGSIPQVVAMFMISICWEYYQFLLAQAVLLGIGMTLIAIPTSTIVPLFFERN
ncbi:hypothetical protein BST61_g3714 [Cercospora zeina]